MEDLESVKLSDVYPATGESTCAIENETEPQDGFTRPAHGRLDSWKEIAVYFSRSVRCVQRWERFEAMPVHRHRHRRGASVYAYRLELDVWWKMAALLSTSVNQS